MCYVRARGTIWTWGGGNVNRMGDVGGVTSIEEFLVLIDFIFDV